MEATYYTYLLYALIMLFMSISVILSAKNDKLKSKIEKLKKLIAEQGEKLSKQDLSIAQLNATYQNVVKAYTDDITKLRHDLITESEALIIAEDKYRALSDRVKCLSANLPDRREKESDAQYFKRCRQSVANKAATYAKVNDRITLKVISHD